MKKIILLCVILSLVGVSASAGQGWYLLMPAMKIKEKGAPGPDNTIPLSKWEHIRSFDTALECEAMKQKNIPEVFIPGLDKKNEKSLYQQIEEAKKEGRLEDALKLAELQKHQTVNTLTWLSARCIATDDPRLSGK